MNFKRLRHIRHPSRLIWTIVLLFFTGWLQCAQADFEITVYGTRSIGMGRAYTALAGDGEALAYNIAGLARTPKNSVFTSYADLFGGLSRGSITHFSGGLVYHGLPFLTTLGVGVSVLSTPGYQELQFPIGTTFRLPMGIDLGVALRGLYWGTTPDVDPMTGVRDKSLSKFTFTADAGAYYEKSLTDLKFPWGVKPAGKISVGLSIRNLIPLSTAVDANQSAAGRIPLAPRLGFAWFTENGLLSIDYALQDGGQLRVGGELNALQARNRFGQAAILIRAGAASSGNSGGAELTGGFGVKFNQFRLDAAYVWSQSLLDAGATQRYALTYEF